MDINGCQIVSIPTQTPEGWTSTVTKAEVFKGPFDTIAEAIACAQSWESANLPPGTANGPSIAPIIETSPNATTNVGTSQDQSNDPALPTATTGIDQTTTPQSERI